MRTQFRTLIAVSTIATTLACGGGSPTSPSPTPTATPPPTATPAPTPTPTPAPGPATVTMTVEVTGAAAVSGTLDVVRRGNNRQRRRARTRARLVAQGTAPVTVDRFGCTATADGTTLSLDSLTRTNIIVLPGTPQEIESTNTFEFPSPLPAGDLVVSCTGSSPNVPTFTADGRLLLSMTTPLIVPCMPDVSTLCAEAGRFMITAEATNAAGQTAVGRINSADRFPDGSGLFWFFSQDNWEVLVKVLDGCRQNNYYWVVVEGRTNVGLTVTVTDTKVGVSQSYFNLVGQTPRGIQDTAAFATCGQ